MNAIERIRDMEKAAWMIDKDAFKEPFGESCLFLLRAFKVMRKIAIRAVDDELTGPQSKRGIAKEAVDAEFDEAMQKKTNEHPVK